MFILFQNQLKLTYGTKQYCIKTPFNALENSPHRPKMTNSLKQSLEEYFSFATSSIITTDPTTTACYHDQRSAQRKNKSLTASDVLQHVVSILKINDSSEYLKQLWSSSDECTLDKEGKKCWKRSIISLRISFIIPAMKDIFVQDNDFNMIKTPRRYMDTLGKMTSLSEIEAVIVEASSGCVSENVGHSIEDTLKSLECATASLTKAAHKYNIHQSKQTFKNLKTFSIQLIKNDLTLSSTYVNDQFSWTRVELRTAAIPMKWDERLNMVAVFELLTCLLYELRNAKDIERLLNGEHIGIAEFNSETVEEFMKKRSMTN
ncbi:hypothetical protein BDA99DRAFT_561459 [Phascolomyces articulosus]|uniref:Uncharacterized protein n=1 Tax=Phascolomyces articulosus TaxID=60185 RepID=A0AAD5JWU2_9FUNG|nr:hypothetical protein BDA99DRAFT_561459 [Phascolomyces articulosus]